MLYVKLAPSDLTFLWDDCPLCFYRKVKHRISRPSTPFPKVFTILDNSQKIFFGGKRTEALHPSLPPGEVVFQDNWVQSEPIVVPGHRTGVMLRGFIDTALAFDDGTYGIVDFKTAEPRQEYVAFYGRQLHAYALAAESPMDEAPTFAPVSRLGLLCFEPNEMIQLDDGYAYRASATWIDVPRDDDAFLDFLGKVLDLIEASDPPKADPKCGFCKLRSAA